MHIIKALNSAQAWINVSNYILNNANLSDDIVELLNVAVEIESCSIDKEFDISFRSIFGDERIDYAKSVTFIKPESIPDLAESSILRYRYNGAWDESYWGRMIAYQNSVNQVELAIKKLRDGKNTKICQIIIWDPKIDSRKFMGVPCLQAIDLKPRDDRLYLTAFMRSSRVSKSGYADYVALTELCDFIANESNLAYGLTTVIACSCHIGKMNQEYIKTKELLKVCK